MTDIEREIDLRVAYKVGQLFEYLANERNRLMMRYPAPAYSTHQSIKLDVINELQKQVNKEVSMSVPYSNMSEQMTRDKMDSAMEKIRRRLNLYGKQDRRQLESFFVDILKEFI